MTLKSRLLGAAIGAYIGGPGQKLRAAAAEASRRVRRAPKRVDFYHDVSDPWSYLLAQAIERLAPRWPVEWVFHLVSQPASDVAPEPGLRRAHAIRDAIDLASRYDVSFPQRRNDLDQLSVRWTAAVLVRPRPFAEQLRAAIELGEAGWGGDAPEVQKLVGKWGAEGMGEVAPILATNYTALREAGHYQGGMLHYGGEWYWGIDRLAYLEARLAEEHEQAPGPPVVTARPALEPERLATGDGRLPVEFWYSFRSPYSYLVLDRLDQLRREFPIDLRIRPILPMVARGLPAVRTKVLYIARDAKREADRLGVPFGNVADPLGKGVEHALAISKLAIARGRGLEFLRSASTGSWAEARDLASYVDLRFVVERAGLDWNEAKAAIADESWRGWATDSAADLATIGLWGVPSFRAGEYVTWGQDRIEHLAERLRGHFAAPPRVVQAGT